MKLDEWLRTNGITQAAFGQRVGARHSTVSRWISGVVFPSGDALVRIRRATGGKVSAEDFMPPEPVRAPRNGRRVSAG